MNYERFSQLWDALVANKPKHKSDINEHVMSDATKVALIEYGNGNKVKVQAIREFLKRKALVVQW